MKHQDHTFIATMPLDTVRPQVFQGVQALACYSQFLSLLEGQKPDELRLFLAEPVFDATQTAIDWYTIASGPLRRLDTLTAEEQKIVRARFAECAARICDLALALQEGKDSNARMAGGLLALTLTYPSEEHLYATPENIPVLTGWGCAPSNIAATPEPLIRLAELPVGTTQPPDKRPLLSVPAPTATVAQSPATPKPVPTPFRMWWLLFFLLGFLLCALLMPWLLPQFGLPTLRLDFLPGGCAPITPPASEAPLPPAQKKALDGLTFSQDKEQALRQELRNLQQSYAERLAACPPKTEKIEPPAPPIEKPPEKPMEPPPPSKLEIPDTPTDLTFLEGCWMAGEDMMINIRTKLPVAVKFCFDKNGKGEALVQEFDKKGRKVKECRGTATATLKPPNTLLIDDKGSIRCPDGSRYERTKATCINKDNIAVCSRPKYDDVPFTRTTR